jgi:cell division protein FtsN
VAQDDYYYEIQLTNKQLVFYFLAGATGLILSFLAGVMVGRGVDAAGGEVQAAKAVHEDKIVPEETRPSPAATQELTYAQRLEGEKPAEDELSKSPTVKTKSKASPAATKAEPRPSKAVADASTPASQEASPKPSSKAVASSKEASPAPSTGTFTIQVGAFKDKASAELVVTRLKGKGFAAFVIAPEGADGGLFNVRVGSYQVRADAQRVEKKLRDEEKFQPFIVHQ